MEPNTIISLILVFLVIASGPCLIAQVIKNGRLQDVISDLEEENGSLETLLNNANADIAKAKTETDSLKALNKEQSKELEMFRAESAALLEERNELQDLFDRQAAEAGTIVKELEDLRSRIQVVSREMPESLVTSRKTERLSVHLHKFITYKDGAASIEVLLPPFSGDTAAAPQV